MITTVPSSIALHGSPVFDLMPSVIFQNGLSCPAFGAVQYVCDSSTFWGVVVVYFHCKSPCRGLFIYPS